jgi:SAM-dependent methyltransferase
VVTDQQSVGLILPVMISSDLPPVESQRGRKVAPPRRLSREDEAFDGIEEIEPEAEITVPDGQVPKGPPGSDTPSPPPGELAGAAGRRAPPPRRARDEESGIEVDLDLDGEAGEAAPTPRPPAVTSPAAVPPPPPVPPTPVFEAPSPTLEAPSAAASTPGGPQADAEVAAPTADGKPTGTPAPKAPKRKKPWWSELFEEDYAKTIDTPTEKDVAREADFIERVLNLAKGARVLDLGCGLGRHAVELASRGYEMVGVDHSTLMLAKANEHAAERGLGVNFVKGDMRKLSLDAVFDGMYCWSQTFGYFDEQTNHGVLESIHRALRQGGTFALDVANRDFVAPRSPTMVWFERPGCVCMDEMKFDFYTSRMIVKRTVLFETGRSREIEYSMRMYSLHELGRMLHGCGFRVLEVSGHRAHPGTYFGSESPRIIVAAERV